jgi:hypothetical protein
MEHEKNKFSYRLSFFERLNLEGHVINHHYVDDFAAAKTVDEAVGHLAKVLDGSISFKRGLKKGVDAKLISIQLMSGDKELLKLHTTEGTESVFGLPWFKKPTVSVQWGKTDFSEVNRELLDALVKTFPERELVFKGKALYDAMGL